MSVFGRTAIAALVFTGSVAAAAYASNNEDFYNGVTSTVGKLTQNVEMASGVMSGDAHIADPSGTRNQKRDMERIESSSVVTHVEVVGGGPRQRIVLLDPNGEEVFTHDPESNTTIIAKDVVIPSITVRDGKDDIAELRVVTAARATEAPAELRQALADNAARSDLFYRDDL